jgi:hypothetical protein
MPELQTGDLGAWTRAYAIDLWNRRAEARTLHPLRLFPAHRHGTTDTCHEDVACLASHNGDCQILRGWLYRPFEELERYGARFIAHSVLEERSGELVCVAPIVGTLSDCFIRANLADGDFLELVAHLNQSRGGAVLEYESPGRPAAGAGC